MLIGSRVGIQSEISSDFRINENSTFSKLENNYKK